MKYVRAIAKVGMVFPKALFQTTCDAWRSSVGAAGVKTSSFNCSLQTLFVKKEKFMLYFSIERNNFSHLSLNSSLFLLFACQARIFVFSTGKKFLPFFSIRILEFLHRICIHFRAVPRIHWWVITAKTIILDFIMDSTVFEKYSKMADFGYF